LRVQRNKWKSTRSAAYSRPEGVFFTAPQNWQLTQARHNFPQINIINTLNNTVVQCTIHVQCNILCWALKLN
jgi:hypothetical protein